MRFESGTLTPFLDLFVGAPLQESDCYAKCGQAPHLPHALRAGQAIILEQFQNLSLLDPCSAPFRWSGDYLADEIGENQSFHIANQTMVSEPERGDPSGSPRAAHA